MIKLHLVFSKAFKRCRMYLLEREKRKEKYQELSKQQGLVAHVTY